MSRRREVASFWDDVVRSFFAGGSPHLELPELRRWFAVYAGKGRGVVTTEAFPEPYIGPLSPEAGEPRVVALGLNPGEADLAFQGRSGVFRWEIDAWGGFARWAVSAPYLREPWRSRHRHNRYHAGLRSFAQAWTGDPSVRSEDVLVLELFPWHSDKVTARMRPDLELVDRFVWAPLSEVETEVVVAFGKEWGAVAERLGLLEQAHGAHFRVPTRQLRVFELPSGQRLAVVWQPGYSGPPGPDDVGALQWALGLAGTPQRPGTAARSPSLVRWSVPSRVESRTSAQRANMRSARSGEGEAPRRAHLHAFARHATLDLLPLGFGPVRVPTSLRFMPVRWPEDLWYRALTQQGDLHLNVTADSVSFRVHIDAVHGDRHRNEAAFDRIRGAVEEDLLALLPSFDAIDWRAAGRGRGANQVCAVSTQGGTARAEPERDAAWVAAVGGAWLQVLRRHPLAFAPEELG